MKYKIFLYAPLKYKIQNTITLQMLFLKLIKVFQIHSQPWIFICIIKNFIIIPFNTSYIKKLYNNIFIMKASYNFETLSIYLTKEKNGKNIQENNWCDIYFKRV